MRLSNDRNRRRSSIIGKLAPLGTSPPKGSSHLENDASAAQDSKPKTQTVNLVFTNQRERRSSSSLAEPMDMYTHPLVKQQQLQLAFNVKMAQAAQVRHIWTTHRVSTLCMLNEPPAAARLRLKQHPLRFRCVTGARLGCRGCVRMFSFSRAMLTAACGRCAERRRGAQRARAHSRHQPQHAFVAAHSAAAAAGGVARRPAHRERHQSQIQGATTIREGPDVS